MVVESQRQLYKLLCVLVLAENLPGPGIRQISPDAHKGAMHRNKSLGVTHAAALSFLNGFPLLT